MVNLRIKFLRPTFFAFLIALSFVQPEVYAAKKCTKALVQESFRVIKSNDFNTTRGLDSYASIFGWRFTKKILSMTTSSHWLDSGAGSAFAAKMLFDPSVLESHFSFSLLADNIRRKKREGSTFNNDEEAIVNFINQVKASGQSDKKIIPNVSAVTYTAKRGFQPTEKVHKGKFKMFRGRFLEEIPDEELLESYGKADLITDLFGVFAYTSDPSSILEKYLRLLSDDGEIQILLRSSNWIDHIDTVKVTALEPKRQRTITLIDWLQQLSGVDVEIFNVNIFGMFPHQSAIIKKRYGQKPAIPKLKLIGLTTDRMPPIRTFEQQ